MEEEYVARKNKKYIENEVEVYARIYIEVATRLPTGIENADILKATNLIYHEVMTQTKGNENNGKSNASIAQGLF